MRHLLLSWKKVPRNQWRGMKESIADFWWLLVAGDLNGLKYSGSCPDKYFLAIAADIASKLGRNLPIRTRSAFSLSLEKTDDGTKEL